jgi:uncharacterized membrane protein
VERTARNLENVLRVQQGNQRSKRKESSMNTANDSRMNGIVAAIGIIVLLLGTATGNAYVMFAMASVAIITVAIFGRKSFSWRALFAVTVAAMTAFAVAVGITSF